MIGIDLTEGLRETPNTGVESTTPAKPRTFDRQSIATHERLNTGSKSWADTQRDKHQYEHHHSFPASTGAETTFHGRDAEADFEDKFDRLFLLQHGRQHPAEQRADGYSEGWDGHKVRQENVYRYHYGHILLTRANAFDFARKAAIERALKENLNGFNRYYGGFEGAVFGFAFYYQYRTRKQARESYLREEANNWIDSNWEDFSIEKLIDYVWENYGGVDA